MGMDSSSFRSVHPCRRQPLLASNTSLLQQTICGGVGYSIEGYPIKGARNGLDGVEMLALGEKKMSHKEEVTSVVN